MLFIAVNAAVSFDSSYWPDIRFVNHKENDLSSFTVAFRHRAATIEQSPSGNWLISYVMHDLSLLLPGRCVA
jgi:hypothetical protein